MRAFGVKTSRHWFSLGMGGEEDDTDGDERRGGVPPP